MQFFSRIPLIFITILLTLAHEGLRRGRCHSFAEAFEVVCQYIQASYLFAATDEDRQLIETLVGEMNQVVADFKTSHRESQAQRKRGGGDMPPEPAPAENPEA